MGKGERVSHSSEHIPALAFPLSLSFLQQLCYRRQTIRTAQSSSSSLLSSPFIVPTIYCSYHCLTRLNVICIKWQDLQYHNCWISLDWLGGLINSTLVCNVLGDGGGNTIQYTNDTVSDIL